MPATRAVRLLAASFATTVLAGCPAAVDAPADGSMPDASTSDAAAAPDAPLVSDAGIDAPAVDVGIDAAGVDAGLDAFAADAATMDAGSGPATYQDFLTAYAAAICTYFARCSFFLAPWPGSVSCEEYLTATIADTPSGLLALIASGSLRYDPAGAATCLASVRTMTCGDYFASVLTACGWGGPLVSTLADGAVCTTDFECASLSCDDPSGCGNSGHCLSAVPIGGACTSGGQPCASPSYCGSGGVCVLPTLPGRGTACTGVCSGPDLVCWSGTCHGIDEVTRGPLGSACDLVGGPRGCDPGLVCAGAAPGSTCQAGGVAIGGACVVTSAPSQCASGAWCDAGVCAALPTEAQNCDGPRLCTGGNTCACPTSASCTTGNVCIPVHRVGESCTVAAGCWSHLCDGTTCTTVTYCD